MNKYHRLNNKKWCDLYDEIESFTECGSGKTVATGMIVKLQRIIHEAYIEGVKDSERNLLQARRSSAGRRVSR